MDLKFKFQRTIYKSGEVSSEPVARFDNEDADNSLLWMFLREMDYDFTEKEFFYDLDHWEEMAKNKHWNTDIWSLEKNADDTVTISDIHGGEDDWEEDELAPSITLPVQELKNLLVEYRKRAKEFRENIKNSEKE